MPLNIESEIISLVKDPAVSSTLAGPSAFYSPIIASFAALTPPLTYTISSPQVLQRLAYNQPPQNILQQPVPYLYWTGPTNYDKGQAAVGSAGTKKVDFWFWCCHSTLTDSMMWVNNIEAALDLLVLPYVLVTGRLTAAILIDKHPILDDQTIRTAQEFPVSRACIGYTFGYQQNAYP